ncbi:hypothetical protein D1AOALGA4SA_12102 [Olavius algarvensis Delta 1 endosymbiont]|nr:hypothetical protein D1AOALGA4SA_12102 [Olavius algarvensis Delta 1 endosymbiont]
MFWHYFDLSIFLVGSAKILRKIYWNIHGLKANHASAPDAKSRGVFNE